ncbi:hypothetical protein [Mucilaginibacter rubeus]|nr:hypothetical protein [Mucilaginibacter rubeus]QEM15704.1 hypothetical protein DIU38_006030 [Mucilaginibacter gossypii]QTE59554.1 hypothetical protein J3L23_13395 [Mucilaginibacter rubeus]QTE60986.1 hypothetical protein J3L22_20455 [Mucilaginibacter rubeus]QTF59747.1 hypothetical protein J3L20_20105 [Mucilaginibacter rubeus]
MMNATLKIMAACLLLLAACQNPGKDKQDFIPGTYVKSAKSEYSIADDTLIIEHTNGTSYKITQRTTYQAIRDGKLLPKKHLVHYLNASWDDSKQELDETTTGKVYHADPLKQVLTIKNLTYHKIR